MTTYILSDIFNLKKIRDLMETFYKVTGVSSGLVDCQGNILIRVGWQEICTRFHRENQVSRVLCQESDKNILSGIKNLTMDKKKYYLHKCNLGLYFAVSPIKIRDQHLANFMFGQFFLDPPDKKFFREQAKNYGYVEEEYISALERVPICDLEKFDSVVTHFRLLADVIGEMGISRLELIEAKKREVLEAQNLLKKVFDNVNSVAVQEYNAKGEVQYWNPASEALYGWDAETAIGKTLDKLIFDKEMYQEFKQKLEALAQGKAVIPEQWNCTDREGKEKIVYSTVIPVNKEGGKSFVCINIDITELKNYERQIARLDRLNLIAEMVATISHEVRNPLTTIRGFLQLLSEKGESDKNAEYYELMIQELDRASGIITEFLSLARNKAICKEKVDLNNIIETMLPLIEANAILAKQQIEVKTGIIPELYLDHKEIRQLLLNLTRNAVEAMGPGGRIIIKTYTKENYVVLSVSDNGPGIDPDVLEKIGTPFLTTKPNGTGLGLAVCHSIALRHEASIEVETGKEGTTFLVKFPMSNE